MPDLQLLLCAPGMDSAESAASLDMMRSVDLPGATKFVVTTGKFDTRKEARAYNIEAAYPLEPAHLQTLDRWAEPRGPTGVLRDAYDLYCLRRILGEHDSFDLAVLLRNAGDIESRWPQLLASVEGRPFITFECPSQEPVANNGLVNLLFDLRDRRTDDVLNLVGDLFSSGAAYGIRGYSTQKALDIALGASTIEELIGASLPECPASREAAERPHHCEAITNDDRISV